MAELTGVYIGPGQLLVLVHVVPVDGAERTAGVGRLRRRLLAVPAIAGVEITPVERAPCPADGWSGPPGRTGAMRGCRVSAGRR